MNSSLELEPLIEFRNISKYFDDNKVLDDINLTVKNGEFLTFLGPSGCGKTTLLRILAGFETPSAGSVLINGKDVTNIAPNKRTVNTVFQNYALFPHMNVYENVAFGLRMKKMPEKQIEEEVLKALRIVKMESFIDRKPSELSGGQQQRIAIARAFINKPKVLLLDEPLSALDYKLRGQMQIELKELRRQLGITFIFVTHDQEEAFSMSDRVVVMNNGIIEQTGTPSEIYEEPNNMFVANFVGQINELEGQVIEVYDKSFDACIDGLVTNLNKQNKRDTSFIIKQGKVKVLLRPEDLRVERVADVDGIKEGCLSGVIVDTVYKGMTIDVLVKLNSGKIVMATEFFNEDDPDISYNAGEKVLVSWVKDWEVVLPNG